MKQTLEQAAEQYGRRIDAEHPSNAATDFLAGFAWQKQQGVEWISVEVMPKMNDLGILPILITDGKEVKVWYMLHPLVLKTGDFNATHWAYITLPKIDE